jgi:CheY-like chemotaxis protein
MKLFPFLRTGSVPPSPQCNPPEAVREHRVLIAEDIEQIAQFLEKVVTTRGHQAVRVADGEQAWALLSADFSRFDVVLTDYHMPRLNGLDLTRKLKASPFAGRIVVHTSRLTSDIERAFRDGGADQVLIKTSDPDLILQAIAGPFSGA